MRAIKSIAERFWSKVEKTDGCWFWRGSCTKFGYGMFCLDASRKHSRHITAHRMAYLLEEGPIPIGLTIDHLCAEPRCVRPDHLRPETRGNNCRRGTRPGFRRSSNKSGYQGVYFYKRYSHDNWVANLLSGRRPLFWGRFPYAEAAAMAYNVAARTHFGSEFRNLNIVEMG